MGGDYYIILVIAGAAFLIFLILVILGLKQGEQRKPVREEEKKVETPVAVKEEAKPVIDESKKIEAKIPETKIPLKETEKIATPSAKKEIDESQLEEEIEREIDQKVFSSKEPLEDFDLDKSLEALDKIEEPKLDDIDILSEEKSLEEFTDQDFGLSDLDKEQPEFEDEEKLSDELFEELESSEEELQEFEEFAEEIESVEKPAKETESFEKSLDKIGSDWISEVIDEVDKASLTKEKERITQKVPPKPKPAVPEQKSPADVIDKVRRSARVIATNIKIYNEELVKEGIKKGSISKVLEKEIARGKELFLSKIPPKVENPLQYYYEALVQILAEGNKKLIDKF